VKSRRQFFKSAGGLIASVAIAQGVVRKLFGVLSEAPTAERYEYDPLKYMGDFYKVEFKTSPWINLIKAGTFPEGMGETTRSIK